MVTTPKQPSLSSEANSMAIIAYAELLAGGDTIFTFLVLVCVLVEYRDLFLPTILEAARQLANILATLFRRGGLRSAYHVMKKRAIMSILQSPLGYPAMATLDWYFPPNDPLVTIFRLGMSVAGVLMTYSRLIVPGIWYLSGVSTGFQLTDWMHSEYYRKVLYCRYPGDRPSKEAAYCTGERAGIDLRMRIDDDWKTSWLLVDEIHHIHIIGVVVAGVFFVSLFAFLFDFWLIDDTALLPPHEQAVHNSTISNTCTKAPCSDKSLVTQKEINLQNIIKRYQDLINRQEKCLTAKCHEINTLKHDAKQAWETVQATQAHHNAIEEIRARLFTENTNLRRELAQKDCQLTTAKSRLKFEEEEAAANAQILSNKIIELERLLEEMCQEEVISPDEIHALKTELQDRGNRLSSLRHDLAVAQDRDVQLRNQYQKISAEYQQLTLKNDELAAQKEDIASHLSLLQASYNELSQRFESSNLANQQTHDQVLALQNEIFSTRLAATAIIEEAQEASHQINQRERALQQTMQEIKNACDMTIAQERAEADRARKQATELSEEIKDMHTKIGLAMRDAQRSHEQATTAQRTIEILELRLSKWEIPQQQIPKRQTGDPGSISTALAQCRVVNAQQQAEINGLRRRLNQLTEREQTGAMPQKNLDEHVEKLRAVLEKERRGRTDDRIQWDKRTRELEAENQKLRISLSNAEASSMRRGGGGGKRNPILR